MLNDNGEREQSMGEMKRAKKQKKTKYEKKNTERLEWKRNEMSPAQLV